MSERFLRGGRLLAFGRGSYATDAQHVSVEFVHPVIVGKRALPALDLSMLYRPWLEALLTADDIVMGFGPPEGDPEVWAALGRRARRPRDDVRPARPRWRLRRGACTDHPFMHQESIEMLYHTLWETVHVFFEHRELGLDTGDAGFLYPFLGRQKQADGRRARPRSRSPFGSRWRTMPNCASRLRPNRRTRSVQPLRRSAIASRRAAS